MADFIEEGIKKGHIKFEDDRKYIIYLNENRRRNYTNPEEQVQAYAFLKLILTYNYNPIHIRQFVPVKMGSETKEADIVVYNDDACTKPHIVVECKRQEVSELEFEQAVKQGFAYSYALAGTIKYVWATSRLKDAFYEVDKESDVKKTVPDIPQSGVKKLAKYKYARGGGVKEKQQLFDLEIVSQDELTTRFKKAHQALWGGGELNPSEAFDELDKLIFCKIWDERNARRGDPYKFQIYSETSTNRKESDEEKTNRTLLERIKLLYEEGRKKDPNVFRDGIRLSAVKCRTVVSYLENVNLGDTDLDSKGRAFEAFMGSFFRGDFGQYFTPRPIVKFIVEVLPIKNDSLVLDTSCGSGGFLLHALDKVRQQANKRYPDHKTDSRDVREHWRFWHDFAEKNLFGIEINEQIARTAKMNMILHDDGHTNVVTTDGLLPVDDVLDDNGNLVLEGIQSRTENQNFVYNHFDFIITNPPFGSSVKQTEKAYLHNYNMATKGVDWLNPRSAAGKRPNQSTEILFIEQCHSFLKENGYLAIVIPDGILTNSSLQYVRDNIEEMFRIVAVISMPQTAFQATGAGVKSSVLVVKKWTGSQSETIKKRKQGLKDEILEEFSFQQEFNAIEKEKKLHIKELRGFDNPDQLQGKELNQSEAYKEWKKEVTALYAEKLDSVREKLTEAYEERSRQELDDYDIFMAIAEDIGYDATGKPTNNNELDTITKELSRFIKSIEKGDA